MKFILRGAQNRICACRAPHFGLVIKVPRVEGQCTEASVSRECNVMVSAVFRLYPCCLFAAIILTHVALLT